MKDECLILFVILLLGLILCTFLGGKGTIEGMEDSYYSKTFYGENGASAQFQKDTNGNYTLVVTTSNGTTATYTTNGTSDNTYTGPDGATATIYHSNDHTVIKVKDSNGNIVVQNGKLYETKTITGMTGMTVPTHEPYDKHRDKKK